MAATCHSAYTRGEHWMDGGAVLDLWGVTSIWMGALKAGIWAGLWRRMGHSSAKSPETQEGAQLSGHPAGEKTLTLESYRPGS